MPPDVRRAYQRLLGELGDKDKDGIPDTLQQELTNLGQHGVSGNVLGVTKTSITVNGKTYSGIAEMPADVRALYEKAMAQAGAARRGVSASLGPGGKSPGAHVSYTYAGSGGDQASSSGSRALFLLLLGAMLGGVVVYMLLK